MKQLIYNFRHITFGVYPIFALALTLSATGCHSGGNTGDKLPPAQNATPVNIAPDSLEHTDDAKLDSLLRAAATAKQDTNLAKLYYKIGDVYAENDFEKAKEYYIRLKNLSEKLNWSEGLYSYAAGFSIILVRQGLIDSAIIINRQALDLAKKEKNEEWTAFTNVQMGTSYFYKGWIETSLQSYIEALTFFEKINDKKTLESVYYEIGGIYQYLNNAEKTVYYEKKAVALDANDPFALFGLSLAYSDSSQYEKSNIYLQKTLNVCKQQNNRYIMAFAYALSGANALVSFDLAKAELYLNKALEISEKDGNKSALLKTLISLGKMEKMKGNYTQSEEYVRKALPLSVELNDKTEEKPCYMILAELSAIRKNYRENMQYWKKMDSLDIAKANETALRSAEEMSAKYETEKKEMKITALEKERQLVIWLSIAGGGVLLLALTTFILLWRWTVQKRRLAESRIKQFEQEKQLVATQAVLEGETRERSRLARDLHDGLGSMLTGVKLNLMELKKGVTLDFREVERFDKAVNLIDESIDEMRRVAHHLMPDSLSRFGLKPAVSDFCKNMPLVRFLYFGDESRLHPETEVMIYRCIYELVNNALKYAGAKKILVQILQRPDAVAFTVQDDGCGFDPSTVTEGSGLQNIRTRVAAFNGIINIDSKPGEGTEINVELRM